MSDVPSLEISQKPRGSSAAFRIDVGLARDRVQRGPLTGSIRIITSDPDFPALVVPVRGEVK